MLRSSLVVSVFAVLATLPGCPPQSGSTCNSSNDCRSDEICVEQRCRFACNSNVDCRGTEVCQSGYCQARTDAGSSDRAAPDRALPDRVSVDSGSPDRGTNDAPTTDRADLDHASVDQPAPDATAIDQRASDSAADRPPFDAAVRDAGSPDLGGVDACTPPAPAWWDVGYARRAPLIIEAAPAGYTLELVLTGDAARELMDLSSSTTGYDLRVVWVASGPAVELDRELLSFGEDRVALRFKLPTAQGQPVGSREYFLYTRALVTSPPPADLRNVYRFFDDFEGHANGSDGTPQFDPGSACSWQVVDSGTAGHVYQTGGAASCYCPIAGLELSDAVVEARVALRGTQGTPSFAGLLVRASGLPDYGATYYNVTLWPDSDRFGIGHVVNGTPEGGVGSTTTTVHFNTWYDVTVGYAGADISATLDHALTIGGSGILRGDTQVALATYNASAIFDDVRVRQRVVPEPVVALGAWESYCE